MRQRFESETDYRARQDGAFQPTLRFSKGLSGAAWVLGAMIGGVGFLSTGPLAQWALAILGAGLVLWAVRAWEGDLRWAGGLLGASPLLGLILWTLYERSAQ